MCGCHAHDWFNKKAITNIIALKNLIMQHRAMHDSNDRMFVVHRKATGKPNMKFIMHESGLHYFDPRNENFTFVGTVSENMESFSKRQVQRAETARALYAKLCYPSLKDFKWVVQSNQIKDCPVTAQDIDVASKI